MSARGMGYGRVRLGPISVGWDWEQFAIGILLDFSHDYVGIGPFYVERHTR